MSSTSRLNDRYFIIDGSNKNALVIVVGMDSPLFGHENQYLKIAENANIKYGFTVFVFSNPASNWDIEDNGFSVVMNTVNENMADNCEVFYFGFSAGASFAMFHAWKYPEIKRMLLVNPPMMVNLHKTIKGIVAFEGVSTLIIGEQDQSIGLGRIFERDIKKGGFDNIIIFPEADHQFTGKIDEFIGLPVLYLFD